MQGDVETAPGPSDFLEDGLELTFLLHVQWQEDRRLEFPGQWLDEGASLVVQVGDRQLGPLLSEGSGTAVGDRSVVGDANHERPQTRERPSEFVSHGMAPQSVT